MFGQADLVSPYDSGVASSEHVQHLAKVATIGRSSRYCSGSFLIEVS